ncbi:unnamed protein product, partial [Ectocarpus sp. 13 AM-2016]
PIVRIQHASWSRRRRAREGLRQRRLFDPNLNKCWMRGQEQRRELKNYTVHYNSATNEQGQPRSGEQNGDVMM